MTLPGFGLEMGVKAKMKHLRQNATFSSTAGGIPLRPIKAIVVSMLAIPALAVLIFGPRSDEALPPDRVIVDYWEKWTGEEEAQMREIVNDFNSTVGVKKHIFVRYVSTSLVNQKTLTATAAGVPPDIAGMWATNLVQFAASDALEPLEDMAREHGITSETYKPVYWKGCNWDGHLYGLISTPCSIALHYNKKVFMENAERLLSAGLDPTRAPRTIAELDAYAAALDEREADGRIERAGYLPLEPGWYTNYVYAYFGGDIWDEKAHKFTFLDPRVIKSFEWVQSYSKKLGADASAAFHAGLGNYDSPQNAFLIGTVAMEQQGPWMANYILTNKPALSGVKSAADDDLSQPLEQRLKRYDWAAAWFPSAVPGVNNISWCDFDTLVIPKGAKHKKEAFEFIAYVNQQEVMEKLCIMHSKNSPLVKVSDNFLEHHKNPYIRIFEEEAKSPNARSLPQVPIMPEVVDEFNALVQRLVLMRGTPEEELRAAQDRLQAKYDAFMEKREARKRLNETTRAQ